MMADINWQPGLNNGEKSLREVYESLPGDEPKATPWIVRQFENPKGLFKLPGFVDLPNHDCIHILLGRGLTSADEAFVVGYTMGNSFAIRPWHTKLFRFVATNIYPGIYRYDKNVFDLYYYNGLMIGSHTKPYDIHLVNFIRDYYNWPLSDLRKRFNIPVVKINDFFTRNPVDEPER